MQFTQSHSRLANLALATMCLWFGVQPPPPSAADDAGPTGADKALRTVGHPPLESPHVNPLAVVAGRVYVANTPAHTVDVIDSATRQVVNRISVGIEPVSLAVRPDGRELWVANHVSDSVSIIDLDSASSTFQHVIDTVQEFDLRTRTTLFDEPVGIAFADNAKAYVALSSENQIAVVDTASRKVMKRLTIPAQEPRAVVVRTGRLYVLAFESGNKTQLSGGAKNDIDGDLVTFDAYEHSIRNNNVLSLGHVVDIVKHPRVPDRDLFVFDTATDRLVATVESAGTLLYGLAVDSKGVAYVAQTDARNDVNGRSGTKKHGLKEMANRAFLNRITRVALRGESFEPPAFFDLEPLPPAHPERGAALATPFAIQVTSDDSTLVATAAASDKLFTVDAASGRVLGQVAVGAGPRGVALDGSSAWVLNALADTVSLVDWRDRKHPVVVATITLDDPTHPTFKRGRIAFNTAKASTTGTFSCASCHPDGHTDQLLWVLDTPVVTGGNQIMPRSTMPARGLRDTAPFHWDGIPGDPYGGIHSASIRTSVAANSRVDPPTSATRHLIDGGLASTMHLVGDASRNEEGKVGELTAQERDDMAAYLLGVPYPPAPKRAYSDRLSERAKSGFRLFHVDGDHDPKQPTPNVCGNCHRMPFLVSTNTPGTGMDAPTWRGAQDRWLILPQGRLNIIAFDFYRSIAERGAPERDIWRLSWAYRQRFDPVWDMVVEMSTGFSGAFGRQVAMNRNSSALAETNDLLDSLETAATDGAVVLECDGVLLEAGDAKPIALQFSAANGSPVYRNKSKPQIEFTRRQLLELAEAGRFTGTVTARHGARASLDHPQPALWTLGPIERQRGRQAFPILHPDRKSIVVSGRHFDDDARLFLDGRRVAGTVRVARAASATGAVSANDATNATGAPGATNAVQVTGAAAANAGTKNEPRPLAADERVEITLESLPSTGLHFLQVQAPEGFFSNEFLVHVAQDAEAAEQLERELIRQSSSPWDGLAGAIGRGDLAAVKRFAANKETADKRLADGSTPLSAAALRGHLDIAKHLLEVGADPSATNADGNTPLHVAAFLCREELVRLLLSKKAPLDRKNSRGETPLDVVTGAWTPALADFYTGVANSASIKLDHVGLEEARKKMASLLRNP